jgi:translation initiation factor 1
MGLTGAHFASRFHGRGRSEYDGRVPSGAMPKKHKPTHAVPTGPSGSLTHSPFASLRGGASPSGSVAPSADAPAPPAAAPPAAAPPAAAPPPAAQGTPSPRRGRLVLRRETKHRGGKTAIIVTGFGGLDDLKAGELESLARELKRSLACGGSLEGVAPHQEIVLQGDQPARVAEFLRARGFRVAGVVS